MGDKTGIEWTDATWNPMTGCTKVSAGCKNCYAERDWKRLVHLPEYSGRNFTDVRCHDDRLDQPLRWVKPRRIFVNSMSDLFHEDVPNSFIDKVFAVIALAPKHTFQILTKRALRMREYLEGLERDDLEGGQRITAAVNAVLLESNKNWDICGSTATAITTISKGSGAREPYMLRSCSDGMGVERLVSWREGEKWMRCADIYAEKVRANGFFDSDFGWGLKMWPLPNVWIGVSVESQETADERIPLLLETPSAVRWISAEPLISKIDLFRTLWEKVSEQVACKFASSVDSNTSSIPLLFGIDWVVVGGESGPMARPMHPQWVRDLRDQCEAAGVPFLFKQWGEWLPDPSEYLVPLNIHSDLYCWGGHGIESYSNKVGKKRSGRLLDGKFHDGYPVAHL